MHSNVTVGDKTFPAIGFGPAAVGYSPRMRKQRQGINALCYRALNKFFFRPSAERKYIDVCSQAFRVGYRLLDYSASYGNGALIGKAIRESGVPREELFLTTRVSNYAQRNNIVRKEFMNCLHGFGVDFVDLLQFHWPVTGLFLDTWREMERLYEEGLVKHLGVANCHPHHLEQILNICKVQPEVGQFEIHPLFTQKPLIEYYKQHGILVEAYTPIARYDDRLVRLPLLKRLEQKYRKNFVQIILRWHIQNGVVPLIRSMSKNHLQSNFELFDFQLDEEDMQAIDGININSRLRYDPDNCDFTIL